jgi:hypothetical protein
MHEGGIEVGKKSMKAIDEVIPPTNFKELQSLLGKTNFVRRFISNLSQKVLPFLKDRLGDQRGEGVNGSR